MDGMGGTKQVPSASTFSCKRGDLDLLRRIWVKRMRRNSTTCYRPWGSGALQETHMNVLRYQISSSLSCFIIKPQNKHILAYIVWRISPDRYKKEKYKCKKVRKLLRILQRNWAFAMNLRKKLVKKRRGLNKECTWCQATRSTSWTVVMGESEQARWNRRTEEMLIMEKLHSEL